MKVHKIKEHKGERITTFCGGFIPLVDRVSEHWRNVTCKSCLAKKPGKEDS